MKRVGQTGRGELVLDISIAEVLTRPSTSLREERSARFSVRRDISSSFSLSLNFTLSLPFSPRSIAEFHLSRRCLSFRGSSENQFRHPGVNAARDSVASCRGSSTFSCRIISFTVFLFLLIQMSPENFLFTRMRLDTLNWRNLGSSTLT